MCMCMLHVAWLNESCVMAPWQCDTLQVSMLDDNTWDVVTKILPSGCHVQRWCLTAASVIMTLNPPIWSNWPIATLIVTGGEIMLITFDIEDSKQITMSMDRFT